MAKTSSRSVGQIKIDCSANTYQKQPTCPHMTALSYFQILSDRQISVGHRVFDLTMTTLEKIQTIKKLLTGSSHQISLFWKQWLACFQH